MPRVITGHKGLRPYESHGLRFHDTGPENSSSECPFCSKEDDKFQVRHDSGEYQCFSCGSKGNSYTFLRWLHDTSFRQSPNGDLLELAKDRGLLFPETLTYWEATVSFLTSEWIIPAYTVDGKIGQLHRYVRDPSTGKRYLRATAEVGQQIFGVNLYKKDRPVVYLCEGPWDAMMWWEALRCVRQDGRILTVTASESSSLLSTSNVLAVPGCLTFLPQWCQLFHGKKVVLLYDNDHPKKHRTTGAEVGLQGYRGMRKVAEILAAQEHPPESIHYLQWGTEGYNPKLPSGFDVRDALKTGTDLESRRERVANVLGLVQPIPSDWVQGRDGRGVATGSTDMECLPCTDWKELVQSWSKAMKWIEGLDRAMSIMYASIISVRSVGVPLWFKVVGPASCGKSTLAEALSVAKQYVFANSTMTGFHSGYKTDREGKEDNSMLPKIRNKTLITKDGDTLLQATNKDVILSEARDLYDCVCRVHYRHGVSRVYDDHRMTWIILGTESLRALDTSELGERLLDCVIMDTVDEDLERTINRRAYNQSMATVGMQADGTPESRHGPEMVLARQLSGGYVNHLRENAGELLSSVSVPDDFEGPCIELGTFIAYVRARPSKHQREADNREFSSRLVSQLARLSVCLTAVLCKPTLDGEVIRRVKQTALDTARGRTLGIVKELYPFGREGMPIGRLAILSNMTDDKLKTYLSFLRNIGVVEPYTYSSANGLVVTVKYRLTNRLLNLYKSVMEL